MAKIKIRNNTATVQTVPAVPEDKEKKTKAFPAFVLEPGDNLVEEAHWEAATSKHTMLKTHMAEKVQTIDAQGKRAGVRPQLELVPMEKVERVDPPPPPKLTPEEIAAATKAEAEAAAEKAKGGKGK